MRRKINEYKLISNNTDEKLVDRDIARGITTLFYISKKLKMECINLVDI